ncbi:MAG: hypothetical protein QGI88_13225, partial [SAR202 cluster bacterium]|nr:hypothetical protein [SAR202 cluster bacterium]
PARNSGNRVTAALAAFTTGYSYTPGAFGIVMPVADRGFLPTLQCHRGSILCRAYRSRLRTWD